MTGDATSRRGGETSRPCRVAVGRQTAGAVVGLSLSPTWWRGRAWREPDSRIEELVSGEAFIRAAVLADRAGVHLAFKPDPVSLAAPQMLAEWPAQTGPDPVVLMAAIARETTRIGLIPTYSTTFAPPYLVARELQTLDQISGGRAGWNAVTSRGGRENFGGPELTSRERYARARDMILTVRRLHASYPAAALRIDRGGMFADPSRVRPIERTASFDVTGPLTVPAVRDEPMPLLHAGGSPASDALAAEYADAVFAMTHSLDDGIALRRGLASRSADLGRRTAPRVLPGLTLCLASTREQAVDRYDAGLAGAPAGARHWTVVGTPEDAVDDIARRLDAGAADGFIALPFGSWEAVELFSSEVMPALSQRGLLADTRDTLRATLLR